MRCLRPLRTSDNVEGATMHPKPAKLCLATTWSGGVPRIGYGHSLVQQNSVW